MSPEGDELESPTPTGAQNPVKRRGAISAEPITEEDVASYVKKVCLQGELIIQVP